MSDFREEEALGKVYDRRLARRLFGYLRPYKAGWPSRRCSPSPLAPLTAAGPWLFEIAVDRYIVPALHHEIPVAVGVRGLGRLSLLFLATLALGFAPSISASARDAKSRPANDVRPAQGRSSTTCNACP